jgi:hypothetical protein
LAQKTCAELGVTKVVAKMSNKTTVLPSFMIGFDKAGDFYT